MNAKSKIFIEGSEESELLELTKDPEFQELIFGNLPIVFSAGTSEILGQFSKSTDELKIILSHIDGGGEGVLLKLMNLFRRFAINNQISTITWIVHAVDCPKPNPKLRRILELKGFEVKLDTKDGYVYQQKEIIKTKANLSTCPNPNT